MRSEFAGAPVFGPDLSRWPARMVDAAVVIQQERNREQNARQEAAVDGDS